MECLGGSTPHTSTYRHIEPPWFTQGSCQCTSCHPHLSSFLLSLSNKGRKTNLLDKNVLHYISKEFLIRVNEFILPTSLSAMETYPCPKQRESLKWYCRFLSRLPFSNQKVKMFCFTAALMCTILRNRTPRTHTRLTSGMYEALCLCMYMSQLLKKLGSC